MVVYLIDEKLVQKVVMDFQIWNVWVIVCYEKCGFRKIRLLREYELYEGQMRDCWLMEYDKGEWRMDLCYLIGIFEYIGEIIVVQREQWIQDIVEFLECVREVVKGLSDE